MQGKKEAKTTEADGPFGKSAQRRRFKAEKKEKKGYLLSKSSK